MTLGDDAVDHRGCVPLEVGARLPLEELVGKGQQLAQESTRCVGEKGNNVVTDTVLS